MMVIMMRSKNMIKKNMAMKKTIIIIITKKNKTMKRLKDYQYKDGDHNYDEEAE